MALQYEAKMTSKNLDRCLTTQPGRIIRLPEVVSRIGLSRSTIYEKMASGAFPMPVSLGGRAIGWHEVEIADWVANLPRSKAMKGVA